MEVPDQLKELRNSPLRTDGVHGKVALLNPVGFAALRAQTQFVRVIAIIRRKDPRGNAGATYNAQIYARADSDIKTAADVVGKSIAFGKPQSTSNFLVPAAMLHARSIVPGSVIWAGGHPEAAEKVYSGAAQVGAGHDGVISALVKVHPDAEQVLKRIRWANPEPLDPEWSDAIPSDPVAAHIPDDSLRQQVTEALRAIAPPGQASPGNDIINEFWDTKLGFETNNIAQETYDHLLKHILDFGLTPDDLLLQGNPSPNLKWN